MGKFRPKNQNCQFKLDFGVETNSNMQNSMVMFAYSFSNGNALFKQIWSKKSKLLVIAEICYLD